MERKNLINMIHFPSWLACIFLLSAAVLHGQPIPDPMASLVNEKRLKKLDYSKEGLGRITVRGSGGQAGPVLDVQTFKQPDFIYNLSVRIPLEKRNIRKGEILLLSFMGKTIDASLETGEARMLWVLNTSDEIRERKKHTFSISSEWQKYSLPIIATQPIRADDLYLVLQFGFPPQHFLLKDIAVELFPQGTNPEVLPRTRITYAGMEADAPWKHEATERIKKYRTGDFTVQFTRKGKPLQNTTVQLNLQHHHFRWGAAIGAEDVVNNKTLLDHFDEAFNIAVFENDLKIKFWDRPGRKPLVREAIGLLEERDIAVKGHVLIWPGFNHLPGHFRKYADNPDKLRKVMEKHLRDILGKTSGRISHWDVVNEAYTNRDLQEITGSEEILYYGFREAQKLDPGAARFVNEYGIISKGGLDEKKQQWYYDYIQRIDSNTGGLLDGVGIQCHMGSDLTPPEKVLEILDYYGQLGKQVSISEFTMEIDDPVVREQYTGDFMLAAFSHPAVTEFLFWGFRKEKADIFGPDWQPGSMGRAFFSKVHGDWTTELVETTGNAGEISGNGFFGTYEYRFVKGNQIVSGTFHFHPDSPRKIRVEID